MSLSPNSEKALDAWVGPSTWHTNHSTDMERWYDFINQFQKEHGYVLKDEVLLREHIERKIEKFHGVKPEEGSDMRKTLRERISLMIDILDFLQHTER